MIEYITLPIALCATLTAIFIMFKNVNYAIACFVYGAVCLLAEVTKHFWWSLPGYPWYLLLTIGCLSIISVISARKWLNGETLDKLDWFVCSPLLLESVLNILTWIERLTVNKWFFYYIYKDVVVYSTNIQLAFLFALTMHLSTKSHRDWVCGGWNKLYNTVMYRAFGIIP